MKQRLVFDVYYMKGDEQAKAYTNKEMKQSTPAPEKSILFSAFKCT